MKKLFYSFCLLSLVFTLFYNISFENQNENLEVGIHIQLAEAKDIVGGPCGYLVGNFEGYRNYNDRVCTDNGQICATEIFCNPHASSTCVAIKCEVQVGY